MRKLGFFLTLICCLNSVVSHAESFLLDEQQLFTRKKGCYINYLTEKNTSGWYIDTNREECGKDGVLTGYHNITVYNAFSKPIEKLYGYFSNGYWTGDAFLKKIEFNRFSDELGVQKATFTFSDDNEPDGVHYIGQMTTQKTSAGTYPAFRVCSPMRILGIVDDIKKLDDPHFLQRIFNHVEKKVRLMCPTDDKVMLFLSKSENPKQEDIAVFVQMNLKNRRHKIIRADELKSVPKPSRIKSEKGKTVSVVVGQKKLDTLKQTTHADTPPETETQMDDLVSDDTSENKSASQSKKSHSMKPASSDNKPKSKEISKSEPKTENASETPSPTKVAPEMSAEVKAAQDAAAYFNSGGDTYAESSDDTFKVPTPQKSYLQPLKKRIANTQLDNETTRAGVKDISSSIEPLAHVFLLSKVLNAPVLARVAVHVDYMSMDDTGFVSRPIPADIEGQHVSDGWHIIKGYFIAYPQKEAQAPAGLIRIINTEKCTLSICQEKS